jgi:hypothetical protein
MTRAQIQQLALDLPEPERLELAQSLVESVELYQEIPAWHREVLNERLADAIANPGQAIPWTVAKRPVFSS